ncbi:MAG TPA: AAA family ATPase [Dermatophilaceae bacterium]|nr:AAA family ATPase [Dermatophilaceae bacterium]
MAVLVVVSGLPATGKSTLCAQVASARRATWLRVDRIEDAIVRTTSLQHPVGVVGYAVAYALAAEQLRCGVDVIAECVNPLTVTRDAWWHIADDAGARLVEVEMVCSDASEHRRRAETRTTDIQGHPLPTWQDILDREYEPWVREHVVIDSATTCAPDAAQRISILAWSDTT